MNVISAGSGVVIKRLQSESGRPQGDLVWGISRSLLQTNAEIDDTRPDDMHFVGTTANVLRYVTGADGSIAAYDFQTSYPSNGAPTLVLTVGARELKLQAVAEDDDGGAAGNGVELPRELPQRASIVRVREHADAPGSLERHQLHI